jgi:adenine-specific DNA-methyltransferase
MLDISTEPRENDIVLDFFAGSCTTAQAVLELNREEGGDRRFIMVQMPEPTGVPDLPTIAEVGKERIRRVIARMRAEDTRKLDVSTRETPEDLGFRVFRLAPSNYRNWTGIDARDETDLAEEYARQMDLFIDALVDGWEPSAVIAEVALKEAGFGLNYAVEMLGDDLYRVSDPDTDRSFYLSLAQDVQLSDVEPLGLTAETLFVCRAMALDDTTAGNLQLQCRLKVI